MSTEPRQYLPMKDGAGIYGSRGPSPRDIYSTNREWSGSQPAERYPQGPYLAPQQQLLRRGHVAVGPTKRELEHAAAHYADMLDRDKKAKAYAQSQHVQSQRSSAGTGETRDETIRRYQAIARAAGLDPAAYSGIPIYSGSASTVRSSASVAPSEKQAATVLRDRHSSSSMAQGAGDEFREHRVSASGSAATASRSPTSNASPSASVMDDEQSQEEQDSALQAALGKALCDTGEQLQKDLHSKGHLGGREPDGTPISEKKQRDIEAVIRRIRQKIIDAPPNITAPAVILEAQADQLQYKVWRRILFGAMGAYNMLFAAQAPVPGIPSERAGQAQDPDDHEGRADDDSDIMTALDFKYRAYMARSAALYLHTCLASDIDRNIVAAVHHENAFQMVRALDRHYLRERHPSDLWNHADDLRRYKQQPTETVRLFATNIRNMASRLHGTDFEMRAHELVLVLCGNCLPVYRDSMQQHHIGGGTSFQHCVDILVILELRHKGVHHYSTSAKLNSSAAALQQQQQQRLQQAAIQAQVQKALTLQLQNSSLPVGRQQQQPPSLSPSSSHGDRQRPPPRAPPNAPATAKDSALSSTAQGMTAQQITKASILVDAKYCTRGAHCSTCGKMNHTAEQCFRTHGMPKDDSLYYAIRRSPVYIEQKARDAAAAKANEASMVPTPLVAQAQGATAISLVANGSSLGHGAAAGPGRPDPPSFFGMSSLDRGPAPTRTHYPTEWVLDSGASQHATAHVECLRDARIDPDLHLRSACGGVMSGPAVGSMCIVGIDGRVLELSEVSSHPC